MQIKAEVTLLNKPASVLLEEDEAGRFLGRLSFNDRPLDLYDTLEGLLGNNKSPFQGLDQLDLAFTHFDVLSYDGLATGFIISATAMTNGVEFTVRYGTYTSADGQSAQSFSLLLEPFQLDKLPVINLPLDPPLKIDIREAGYATGDFIDENGKAVKAGLFALGELAGPGGLDMPLVYPALEEDAADQSTRSLPSERSVSEQAPATDRGDVSWYDVDKVVGAAHLKEVGLQWKDGKIWAMVNANISFGGITLSLMGLKAGVEVALPPGMPSFGLDGLGISYSEGKIEIAGAFAKGTSTLPGVTDQYLGAVTVRFTKVLIYGMGAYAKINGQDSIFVYAYMGYPLGGPAFFFVEGLALGFGYNRRFISPKLSELESFPLIAQAMGSPPGNRNDPMAMLQGLEANIPPAEGEMMLAVGIKFSTFNVVKSFMLLVVSFGENTHFDVLGMSRLSLPAKAADPVVFVEIALKAAIDPNAGIVKVDGLITKNSYVYSKDAKLTGGFAFYSWFKDEPETGARAGDFVLTMGGYHPDFKKPDHYPSVPRVTLNWKVDKHLSVKGEGYFAMTPAYGMAGFELKATYKNGSLTVVFTQGADFLIQWEPFHYDIVAYVSMRASFYAKIKLLFVTIRKTFHVDVGAKLHIWGPDFSGHADIHVRVMGVGFSFDVDFGAKAKPPPALTWAEFSHAFLPEPEKVITITPTKGLLKVVNEIWVLNPKEFCLEVTTEVPVTSVNAKGEQPNGPSFGIAPMQILKGDDNKPNSTLTVSIDGGDEEDFTFTQTSKNMPAALWGEYQEKADLNEDALVELTSGVEITLSKDPAPGASSKIKEINLAYDIEKLASTDRVAPPARFSYDLLTASFSPTYNTDDFPPLTSAHQEMATLAEEQSFIAIPKSARLI